MDARRDVTTSLAQTALAIVLLVVLKFVLRALPMMQGLNVPRLPMTVNDLVNLLIMLVIVGILVKFAIEIRTQMEAAAPQFPESGKLAAALVGIIAILLTYYTLSKWLDMLLGENAWIYRLVFLILVLVPLVVIGLVLYRNTEIILAFFTNVPTNLSIHRVSVKERNVRTCPQCGAANPPDAKFCLYCGAPLGEPEPEPASSSRQCPNCGAEYEPGARFCIVCGTELPPM